MDPNGKKTADQQPKRRACDECRGRKLACSKEIDGCARCKREGIKCVYSPQKRMGRPRKHRPVDVAAGSPASLEGTASSASKSVAGPVTTPREEAPPIVMPNFEFDSTIAMDLDMSFLDMNNMDMNFLELVDPNNTQLPLPPAPVQTGSLVYEKQGLIAPNAFWPMSSGLSDINFDEPASSAPPPLPEISAEDVAQILSADLPETMPCLSPPSSSSPSSDVSSPDSDNIKTCGCLSALYLALNSLQTLPKDVCEAMRVARTATKTAHDTILCPVCGDPPVGPNAIQPIQAFQSVMMLGALLPSVSNAYMRILSMVDAEAAAADADRRQIPFSLSAYGGLWGMVAKMDPVKCKAQERLEGALLEPILWRLTVRALLKMDVYGVNDLTAGIDANVGFQQPGLKDIINMMEERSRRRHEQVDAMVAAGMIQKPKTMDYVPLSSTTDKPTCMRIIDIAKRSMDELIIP
ncbi:hypothetical protein N657DRAFT_640198 [Parathielavia appendiculata]|uniref:Zn(2)-C6 fungal-type domain-containing protein n=1 Tax=Parathielavia appendiculata TaxID=2587402 RepID=A0AAN6UB55_9PEZI|nr:hypothetical protein N657DRAFT_640198 [Parathielavia appendiculata]